MLKPAPLHVGDHVAVVSLSSGTLGELTQQHQLNRAGIVHKRAFPLEK